MHMLQSLQSLLAPLSDLLAVHLFVWDCRVRTRYDAAPPCRISQIFEAVAVEAMLVASLIETLSNLYEQRCARCRGGVGGTFFVMTKLDPLNPKSARETQMNQIRDTHRLRDWK